MEQAIQIIIGGLVQGSVFAVVALGLSLVFRVTGVNALEILRGLIERVTVAQVETGFAIELTGEIANMVKLSSALPGRRASRGRLIGVR
jgi:hypothetical protein